MSAFAYDEKDEVVDAIRNLARKEASDGASARKIVEQIMDAVTYGLDYAMSDIEESK